MGHPERRARHHRAIRFADQRSSHGIGGGCLVTSHAAVQVHDHVRTDVDRVDMPLRSNRLSDAQSMFQRAIDLSHDKYCSATIMLGKTAEITTSFELVQV